MREDSKKDEVPTLLREYFEKRISDRINYEIDLNEEDTIILRSGDSVVKLKKPFV